MELARGLGRGFRDRRLRVAPPARALRRQRHHPRKDRILKSWSGPRRPRQRAGSRPDSTQGPGEAAEQARAPVDEKRTCDEARIKSTGQPAGLAGSARPTASTDKSPQGRNHGSRTDGDEGGKRSAGSKGSKAGVEVAKKPKKAALATTGYQGTARPRPGTTPTKAGRPAEGHPRGCPAECRSSCALREAAPISIRRRRR